MQFVLIGLDGTDKDAPERRSSVREKHIEMGDALSENGNLWFGAALLHDDGSMKGSLYVLNFATRDDLDQWLEKEPYVTGDVWQDVTIHESNTRDPWQFSHNEQWFIDNQK